MILIRTDHDEGTHYLYKACDSLISLAERNGFKVANIEGTGINLENIRKRMKKKKPKLIFFNGHGSDSALFDNNKHEFLKVSDASLFKDTITYTRACSCLVKLGKKAVDNGCRAFIGYTKNLWIPKLSGYISRPLKDPVAKPVMESSNEIVKQLIKGNSVQESVEKSQKVSMRYITELIYSNDLYKGASLPALVNNLAALDYYGDAKAIIK